jgi:MoaA/NifB/PqqE/SkfB family radical SAM enzyme
MAPPYRIVLNFAQRCNMSCEWCYVPFTGSQPNANTCRRIVERAAQVGFKVITFGGGDPLAYQFMPDLIRAAHQCRLFVHLDTNGIGLRCSPETSDLMDQIGLLGLPLDGPRAEVHDQMRSARSHFELVISKLEWLRDFKSKIKINTLVSRKNAHTLAEMASFVAAYGPSRWSVYQYWPLSLGKAVFKEHSISEDHFLRSVRPIAALVNSVRLEINPLPSRRLTYPFVSHDGGVYLHDEKDQSAYTSVGSIFDDGVIARVFAHCNAERENAVSRYQ